MANPTLKKKIKKEDFILPPNISFGTLVEARSKQMPSLHPERVFEVGRYSRNPPTQRYVKHIGKNRVLTVANRTLKKKKKKRIFFCPQIYHLGPWWNQEPNGCHRCIRNEFSKWVGTHEILQLNGMSKIWQKHGFDCGKPWPKKKKRERILFCPQIYHLGRWWKQKANGCHRCIRNEFSKWVGTHEILQLNGTSKILQKHGFDKWQTLP